MEGYGANLDNPRYQAIIGRLWNPSTTGEGTDLKEIWTKPQNYSFRYFGDRTGYVKNFDGTNPYETFNQNVLKYNPELRTGTTAGSTIPLSKGTSSAVTNTATLYD